MEKFQIGDKVNFLNATGGGTVKRIIDTRMVEVTIEDGFDIPVLMSDLVLDFRSQPDRRQQIVDNVQKEIQQKQVIEENTKKSFQYTLFLKLSLYKFHHMKIQLNYYQIFQIFLFHAFQLYLIRFLFDFYGTLHINLK